MFAGGATAAAAERVCAAPGGPAPEDVFDLLAALVDKSLVVAVPQPVGAGTRYRMLETIREYAAEHLDEAGERPAAVAAHAQVLLDLAEAAEPRLRRADQLGALAQLRAEADEIDLALRRAVAAGDSDTAYRLVAAVGWSWVIRGLQDELARWARATHAFEGRAPAGARALVTSYMALLAGYEGDTAAATRHVDAALGLAAPVPAPRHPLLVLIGPVAVLLSQGDDGPVRALAERSEDPWVRGFALHTLAQISENEGRREDQRAEIRRAHEVFAALGDRFGLGMVVHALGELEDVAGEADAAARAYDEAIALATELGNEDDLPHFMIRRGLLDARRGDLTAARRLLERAIGLAHKPLAWAGNVHVALAYVALREGDAADARAYLDAAAADIDGAGLAFPQRSANLQAMRTAVELGAGDLAAAAAALHAAVAMAVEGRDGPIAAAVADVAARLALTRGEAERAATLLGIAAAQRGAVDLGSPEVVAAHAGVRAALGAPGAERAVRHGRELPKEEGMALLREFADRALCLTAGVADVPAGRPSARSAPRAGST